MTMEQILLWLFGPGLTAFLSTLFEYWLPWKNWKPAPLLGFNPKMVLITALAGLVGVGAYGVATNRPDLVNTADPLVQTWFPLLAPIVLHLWHAFVNKRLTTIDVKATIPTDAPGVASATVTAQSTTSTANANTVKPAILDGNVFPVQGPGDVG